MSDAMEKLRELPRKWHEEAQNAVPPEYADRGLHGKYLRLDNCATGKDDCADQLESLLPEIEAEIAALKEPMACGHPKACLDYDCHHCCQHQETGGRLPHDCQIICSACERTRDEVAQAVLVESEWWAINSLDSLQDERIRNLRLAANRKAAGKGKP